MKPKDPDELDFEITFYERIVSERPDYVEALIPLAEAYTRKKLYDKGLQVDKRLSQLLKSDPTVHYNLACSYALVGNKKDAIRALKHAIELGYMDFNHLRKDQDLKSLHGDPAFEKLVDYFLKDR